MTFHCGYHLLASNCQVGLSSHLGVPFLFLTLPIQTRLLFSLSPCRLRADWICVQTDFYRCCCVQRFDSIYYTLTLTFHLSKQKKNITGFSCRYIYTCKLLENTNYWLLLGMMVNRCWLVNNKQPTYAPNKAKVDCCFQSRMRQSFFLQRDIRTDLQYAALISKINGPTFSPVVQTKNKSLFSTRLLAGNGPTLCMALLSVVCVLTKAQMSSS